MAILAFVKGEGMTKEVYEQLRKEVNWEGNQPPGMMFHAAGFDSKGIRVADVWNSEQEFNNFINSRLMPAFQKRNITRPETEIIQIQNINVFPQLERHKVAQAQ